ncbi:MAG: hypothetical protein AAF826_05230 [Pseudomonadota bacterium]
MDKNIRDIEASITSLKRTIILVILAFSAVLTIVVVMLFLRTNETRDMLSEKLSAEISEKQTQMLGLAVANQSDLLRLTDALGPLVDLQLYQCPATNEIQSDLQWLSQGCVGQITTNESCTDLGRDLSSGVVRELSICDPL